MNKTQLSLIIMVTVSLFSSAVASTAVRHELFWEYHDTWYNFESWSQTYYLPSSKKAREHCIKQRYLSMLDVGCGACPEYYGFKSDGYEMYLWGIEVTPRLLAFAVSKNLPVQQGNAEKIPFDDACYDVVYARHLLEHLRYYKKALKEMIRVAKKEVLIVFFLEPDDMPDNLDYKLQEKSALFNNRYNKTKLEEYVRGLPRVKNFAWEILEKTVPEGNEAILHIYLEEHIID